MPENPYETPKGMEEQRPARQGPISGVALTLLAVPAAAIAGGGTCLASVMLVGLAWGWSIAAGMTVMIAMLVVANNFLKKRQPNGQVCYNAAGAAVGLMAATPFALISGFAVGLRGYDVGTLGGDDRRYLFALPFLPFLLWSTAFWIGLQWEVGKDQPTQ